MANKKLIKKHPLAIRWMHWINFPVLAIMIWSGLLIYWANDIYKVNLGIGTIKNGEMAQTFIDAGCDYIICPGLVESVARVSDANNMLWLPGCLTPSELLVAENFGDKLNILYTVSILGLAFMFV